MPHRRTQECRAVGLRRTNIETILAGAIEPATGVLIALVTLHVALIMSVLLTLIHDPTASLPTL